MNPATESKALEITTYITNLAIDGAGPLDSAADLAGEYQRDGAYGSVAERVDSLIRWECAKNTATGFLTGLGGLPTLPVAVPASILSAWVVQARLAAAIAALYGHEIDSDRVRTFVLLTLLGDSGKEILKQAGINIGNKMAMAALKKVPGRVLIEINKKVGFRLLTKFGEKGAINLVKWIPLAGGLVGAAVDGISCAAVGKTAKAAFRTEA